MDHQLHCQCDNSHTLRLGLYAAVVLPEWVDKQVGNLAICVLVISDVKLIEQARIQLDASVVLTHIFSDIHTMIRGYTLTAVNIRLALSAQESNNIDKHFKVANIFNQKLNSIL